MLRRLIIAGLAALFAAPAFVIAPASAAVLFSCSSVTGSAVLSPGLVHETRPQSVSSGPTAPAGPADVTLTSVTTAGVKGNGQSTVPSLSADGRKVAFWSNGTNLDPQGPNGGVFVKHLNTGALTLVAPGAWPDLSLSADGTKVAFRTSATDLDPRDTDIYTDIYVKDLTTGALTLASTDDAGVKGNRDSIRPSLSADGKKVSFSSRSTTLDPRDGGTDYDVYVKNLVTGTLKLASTNDAGSKGNGTSGGSSLSADGHRVAFHSTATNFDSRVTASLVPQVYVKELATGDITLAATSDNGVIANAPSDDPALSGDGARVAFRSGATNLDPDATGGVFVKDLTTGDITLASTSDTGVAAQGVAYVSLSANGQRVAFTSTSTDLDPADTDSEDDAYVKDLATGDLTLATTSDTGVKSNGQTPGSDPASLSPDGTVIAFASAATNLDPADTDTNRDVYVKRLPTVLTSIVISDCSNGNSGTASIVDIRTYPPRPLGCPTALGGAVENDYPDTTPILVGPNPRFEIDWASGPNSYGVAAVNAGPTPTQWRVRLAITAGPGHDTPATNQYLPAAGSGATKTRLQGKLDWSALDSFNCASGIDDPLSWLNLTGNGSWVAKTG